MSNSEKLKKANKHKHYAEILNVNHFSNALRKLNKKILIYLAQIINKDICLVCNHKVTEDDFTIGHIKPWRKCLSRNGSADLFWNIDNINLQHKKCNTTDSNPRCPDSYINILPEIHESLYNVRDTSSKIQLSFDRELLGMDFGKANHQLFRKIMFEYCQLAHKNICSICNQSINEIKKWTIEHNKPWFSRRN